MRADGCLFPSFSVISDVSLKIAAAVAGGIISTGRATKWSSSSGDGGDEERSGEILKACKEAMFDPTYNM